jgi:hypothetical protein
MIIDTPADIDKDTPNNIWNNELLKEEQNLLQINDDKIKWNDNLEKETYNIAYNCNNSKINHIKNSIIYSRIYSMFIILGVLIGPISSTLSTTDAFSSSTLLIISSFTGYISGIIIAIIKFGKFEQLSISNKNAAMKYNSLENNIKRQLSLYRTDRIKPDHYLKWIEIKFEEINSSSPLIHKNFLKINNEQPKEYKDSKKLYETNQNNQTDETNQNNQTDENNKSKQAKQNKQTNEILNNNLTNILITENIDKMLLYEMERLKR